MSQPSSATRRRLFKIVGAFFLAHLVDVPAALAVAPASGAERDALAAFLDILLPRDTLSGSATDLHVDLSIWDFSRADERFRQLLSVGCQWLDMTGSVRFAALPSEQQHLIVDWMAAADWNQIPRRFYELVRQIALELYFTQPGAWAGLPISRPPQPLGYPPPWA